MPAYRRLHPLLTLSVGWADLAVRTLRRILLSRVRYTVDDSSELKGTVPADDNTVPEGTVPVDYRTTAELEDEEIGLNQLETPATLVVETRSTLVEGEVRKFLENHWKDVQYWTDIIQSHMRAVREKANHLNGRKGKCMNGPVMRNLYTQRIEAPLNRPACVWAALHRL